MLKVMKVFIAITSTSTEEKVFDGKSAFDERVLGELLSLAAEGTVWVLHEKVLPDIMSSMLMIPMTLAMAGCG